MTNLRNTPSIKRFLQLFKLSLSSEHQDFTTGSINKAIFLLSVPMVLEMVMESLFAVVDVFFVSKISVHAVATVGLTESLLTIIYSLAIGLSMAATAMVSRRIGEKNPKAAARAGMQALLIGLFISIIISFIGIFYSEDLLLLMGAGPEVLAGVAYTRWLLIGNSTILFLFLINGIFRGAGDASLAMRALWIGNITNMILDPILIFGWGFIPAMGIEGAGIASVVGRGVGVLYQVYQLQSNRNIIKVSWEDLKPDFPIIKRIISIAAGGTGQFLIASASWIFLIRIISEFGSDALAGYTIAMRVVIFTILPSWGMSNAAATLVGQNLGAKQPDRAEKSVWQTAKFNVLFMSIVSVCYLTFASDIIRIFTTDSNVIYFGTKCLQIVSLGYVFYGLGMVLVQSFNGAGDTRTPTLINFFGFWCFQIPLAYFLAFILKWDALGAFWAISIAESAIAITSYFIFKKGKWKLKKV